MLSNKNHEDLIHILCACVDTADIFFFVISEPIGNNKTSTSEIIFISTASLAVLFQVSFRSLVLSLCTITFADYIYSYHHSLSKAILSGVSACSKYLHLLFWVMIICANSSCTVFFISNYVSLELIS